MPKKNIISPLPLKAEHIEVPSVPVFLRTTDGHYARINEIPDAVLIKIADEWKEELIRTARHFRKPTKNILNRKPKFREQYTLIPE